jgi:hypothetical protein
MKKIAPIAIAGLLLLGGAGCGSKASVKTTPAPTPVPQAAEAQPKADGYVSAIRAKLAIAGISYTEKSEMGDVEKMQTKASISDALKFKVSGDSGSVRVVVVSVKNTASLAAVKAEMVAQYDQLLTLSAKTRITWLDGDATHLVLVYYTAGDEATAGKTLAALGGQAPTAAAPTAAPTPVVAAPEEIKAKVTVAAPLKKGDKVLANWKNGSKWWEAVVSTVDGPAISVIYDSDKSTDTLGPSAVVLRPSKAAVVKVGDKVAAKWNGGSFYGGTITAVTGSKATVKWGDGSAPSEVPLVDMVLVP